MIYTKTNSHHGLLKHNLFRSLKEARLEANSIYWYDQHDKAVNTLDFADFVEDIHWNHLRTDPTTKILLFYPDEYFCLDNIQEWTSVLIDKQIPTDRFNLIVTDKNWVTWAKGAFKSFGVELKNIQDYNQLLARVNPQPEVLDFRYRFSALSRNYLDWRLRLFLELRSRDLLKNFNYTFNNINPYHNITFDLPFIKDSARKFGYDMDNGIEQWIDGIPYTPAKNKVFMKLSDDIYEIIQSSALHVVIESHFDPFWTWAGASWMHPAEFSPAFPTEKIYKAIACFRPFIVFSTPHFLWEFRQLGFQTFSHAFDESYDEILDDSERLQAIVNEISRLSSLSDQEFAKVIDSCQPQANHNQRMMEKIRKEIRIEEEFNWLTDYINSDDSNGVVK
jgi:hypothetical protein